MTTPNPLTVHPSLKKAHDNWLKLGEEATAYEKMATEAFHIYAAEIDRLRAAPCPVSPTKLHKFKDGFCEVVGSCEFCGLDGGIA